MDESKAPLFDKLADWQKKLVRAGYKMAEGSTVIGSAAAAEAAAGGQVAPGQPAPQPAGPQTAAEAMQAAMDQQQAPATDDYFDDDIPF